MNSTCGYMVFAGVFMACLNQACAAADTVEGESETGRPNILLMIAEDMSWKDWGVYGGTFAKTPTIDKLAEEGVRFSNAFVASPVCHPSRSALLTGQDVWRLRDAAVFGGVLHKEFDVYTDLLSKAGYDVAHSGKGWGPGWLPEGDRQVSLTGKEADLSQILHNRDGSRPFCFWFGSEEGHREFKYEPDGRNLNEIELPPYIPDAQAVREDYAGYYQEVEAFDAQVGEVVAMLEKAGIGGNTILMVTSDHGMPWPRGKGNLYDLGTKVPLIVRWPAKIKPGRVVDDFVSFTDFAPTFLDVAGLKAPGTMTGHSFLKVLKSAESGTIEARRDKVYMGLESHPVIPGWLGYMSCRAIRTSEYLYIRNFEREGHTGWKPVQAGPIVDVMRERMLTDELVKKDYDLCFGLRPEEELYAIKSDPLQINNVANDPQFAETKKALNQALFDYLKKTEDPRAFGRGDLFQNYPVGFGMSVHKTRGSVNDPMVPNAMLYGHNRSGELETFPQSHYSEWMRENCPEPEKQ